MLLRHLASSISVANVEQGPAVLSSARNRPRRIFVGLDSQGALGAFAKGRSSSFRLNRACRKGTAVSLFSGICVFFFWLPSEKMPMDAAPRKYQRSFVQPQNSNVKYSYSPEKKLHSRGVRGGRNWPSTLKRKDRKAFRRRADDEFGASSDISPNFGPNSSCPAFSVDFSPSLAADKNQVEPDLSDAA